jgi:hypothetical protein
MWSTGTEPSTGRNGVASGPPEPLALELFWQKEIELMLKNGVKLEVEALISKDISYVTEEYVPARLKESEFLD